MFYIVYCTWCPLGNVIQVMRGVSCRWSFTYFYRVVQMVFHKVIYTHIYGVRVDMYNVSKKVF